MQAAWVLQRELMRNVKRRIKLLENISGYSRQKRQEVKTEIGTMEQIGEHYSTLVLLKELKHSASLTR